MNEITLFEDFAKGNKSSLFVRGTNCVIYTRVSSKEQADNLSLATQKKACDHYALKFGYKVLTYFGGTYESAENDERKEFQSMLNFVKKSKERISYILVASLERFSRNDNSIWLSGQLRKLGVEIVSVSQPIDTSNPSGQMQQKLLFLFGEFDNQLRKQKCVAGIKEMLLRGDWPTSPPVGYDAVKIDGKRRLIINEKGKLLRQAFLWKAENLSNETIRMRLKEKGFFLYRQRISEILRNPFYCGMVAHNMLEGKVIAGNHEQLISKDIFFKVNGIIAKHTQGYQVIEENEAIPLKRFLLCGHCSKPLRGYIVKAKNIHYYKCCTTGCNNNKNASVLHERFAGLLERFNMNVSKDLTKLIKIQAVATFNQLTKGSDDGYRALQTQRKEIVKKIERLEERYIEEEITGELYKKFLGKYLDERAEIDKNIAKASKRVSNLEKCVETAIDFAQNMPSKWREGNFLIKQHLQYLVYPSGLFYDKKKDECRTLRVNSVFSYIAHLKEFIAQKKEENSLFNGDFSSLSSWVAGAGLEPTTFGL